ncbi:MAG: TIGR01212 family radical SAM protein [Prevotella sp.]|nr:TIGR01212 family radical SAM protein [Prevotella sp.]
MALPYNDFGNWIRSKFPFKIQKISVDAGFSCPNRDGKISHGGCSFCDNNTFNPPYCDKNKTIKEQLERGKEFFKRKYTDMRYLAYFQAYTNTYGSIDLLKSKYEEALDTEDIVGIVIGTRPDCINTKILDYLESLSRQTFLIVEYGIESANNDTLQRINRGHSFECSCKAIEETVNRGIITGGHVILGLPGDDEKESLRQAKMISSTKLNILKIHQLQIIRGTKLEKEYNEHPFHMYTAEEYMKLLAQYIQLLRKDIILERFVSQAPKSMLIAPDWGLKNYEFTNLFVNYLNKINAYQGKYAE